MYEISCPWCEIQLPLSFSDTRVEQTCPECSTTWSFEDDLTELAVELPLAA
jgi:hypothetical protein